jgi:hypothetical protein
MLGDLACQLRSRPRQIAHILNLGWRHEARPYQAVCEKIGNPHRVIDVALATGNIANVRSIREHQFEPALQDVPDRLPVDTGGLHRYVRDPLHRQPIRQLHQIPRCRRKAPHLVAPFRPYGQSCTCDDRVAVHIETGAPSM